MTAVELGLVEVATSKKGSLPVGWRQDRFGDRIVATPPWSQRPPTILPEFWSMVRRGARRELRTAWATEDPVAFAAQERRRLAYIELKEAKEVPACVAATLRPDLANNAEETFVMSSSGSRGEDAAIAVENDVVGDFADILAEPHEGGGTANEMLHKSKVKMLSGHFDLIVLEVCERYSRLGGHVPTRALCIRISRDLLPAYSTKQALHEIIDFAA